MEHKELDQCFGELLTPQADFAKRGEGMAACDGVHFCWTTIALDAVVGLSAVSCLCVDYCWLQPPTPHCPHCCGSRSSFRLASATAGRVWRSGSKHLSKLIPMCACVSACVCVQALASRSAPCGNLLGPNWLLGWLDRAGCRLSWLDGKMGGI